MAECDAGGDCGAVGGGEAAGIAVDAAPTAGMSSSDALGSCDHAKSGYLGAGCFHVPTKCAVPLHRWEVGNGGSKRKKTKKGKDKHYAYEKGMKVVYDMLGEEEGDIKIPKRLVRDRLKSIVSEVKSMADARRAAKKFEAEGQSYVDAMPSKFKRAKQTFLDMGAFLKDICKGQYKASWFTITLLVGAITYVLLPVDLIPDIAPVVGWIDDASVVMWVFSAISDEFSTWKKWRAQHPKA